MMNTLPSKKYFTKTFLLVFSIAMLSNGTKIYASEEAPPVRLKVGYETDKTKKQ